MALTAEEKKRLDKLGFANGGGYSDFLTGVEKQNPSTDKFLFIGLGGKGCSTVAHLKTEVSKKIKCPANKKKPDNFEYLAIDTDEVFLRQLCNGGFGEVGLSDAPEDQEILSLYNADAVGVLAGKPDTITAWMNPSLSPSWGARERMGLDRQEGHCCLNLEFVKFGREFKINLII